MKVRHPFRFGAFAVATVILLTQAIHSQSAQRYQVKFPSPQGSVTTFHAPILGVATHFGSIRILGYKSGEVTRREFEEVGVNSYRDGIAWSSFSFPPNGEPIMWQRRRIIDFLPVAQHNPLLVLGSTDIRLPEHGMPFTDEELANFGAYVRKTVAMTAPYSPIFEVWNEYNMMVGHAKPGKWIVGEGEPSDIRAAVHYARLAKVGVKAVKDANPQAKVLVGAVGEDPDWKWATAIVRYGAMDNADGLSVHLYNHCRRQETRNADELITRVTKLQDQLKALRGGQETPIYVTEFGWPTTNTKCNVSPERSAYNFAHFILQSAAVPWIRGAWMYELKDDDVKPDDIEANFGLFTYNDEPKPAVCFVREARNIVRQARSVELQQPRPNVFAVRTVMNDHQVVAIWTTNPDATTRVTLPGAKQPVQQMCGTPASDDKSTYQLSQAPLIVKYGSGEPISLEFVD